MLNNAVDAAALLILLENLYFFMGLYPLEKWGSCFFVYPKKFVTQC